MKTCHSANRQRGLTLIELFVVITVLVLLAIVFSIAPDRNQKARAYRIQCVNNLKYCGLASQEWAGDHGGKFPMDLAETNGGTAEFVDASNLWRHFQVMSNVLTTPHLLICPSDSRFAATNFATLSNSNISYFIGMDANDANPQMILAGDRNITNGTAIKNGILELTTNRLCGWTAEMHNKIGNIALADGSVQMVSSSGLRNAIANTGLVTNRLQMPVLTP